MRAVARRASFLSCLAVSVAWGTAAPAQTTYKWSDIDCRQSRIASWPGLKCEATNVVTAEGNVGSFRRWSTYGHTSEGYIQIFLWEAQDSFGFINTSEKTAEFLRWFYANGKAATKFSPVARFHNADYSTFRDGNYVCAGFRRVGEPRRGGYSWILGGILCPPLGGSLTNDQVAQFMDRVRLQ